MIIKRYLVSNMNEALTRIRYELGKEAIIISQRKVRKPGIKGLFSGKLIEVTAAVENSSNEVKNNEKKNEEFQNSVESIKKIIQDKVSIGVEKDKGKTIETNVLKNNINSHEIIEKKKEVRNSNSDISSVHEEVNELKTLLNKIIKNTAKEEKQRDPLEYKLDKLDIDDEFHEDIIDRVKETLNDNLEEQEVLRNIFEKSILESTQDLSGRVVLVGPTGVGKTTTIAKLAGRLSLIEKKKVGLITVDTYRIGAIEQLKTYAEIMNIPFRVVITIKEMQEAIESMKNSDVILIDTTGRSSKNAMQISELRAFVQKADPNYISMVISATTKNRDIKSILEGYSELDYDNVIITKLDETTVYGSLYNIAKRSNRPINFITTGQNVPNDIKIPTKEEIARFILGEENLC